MNLNKIYIIVCSFFLLIAFSCKKEKEENTAAPVAPTNTTTVSSDYTLDTFLIQRFLFNPGSYWVYFDSTNNVKDSCYEINRILQNGAYTHISGMHGSVTHYNYRYGHNQLNNSSEQYNYFIRGHYLSKGSEFGPNCGPFGGANDTNIVVTGKTKFINNFSEGPVTLDSIYRFTYTYILPNIPTCDSAYYFMRPGLGIVKTVQFKNGQKKVYNLINYHIQ